MTRAHYENVFCVIEHLMRRSLAPLGMTNERHET